MTITLWNGFTDRELGVVKQGRGAVPRSHPWITVKVAGGVNDDKIVAAIRGGNAPDVAMSFSAATPARSAPRAAGSTSSPT